MKRAAPIVFFLISFLLICPSLSEASLKLYVENEEVQLKHDLVMINGNYMIPLWVFAEHLGAEIEIDGDRIQVDFDDQSIGMQLGVDTAQVNGSEFKLEVAPQRLQGEIIVPLRFMADQRQLSLSFVQELGGFRLTRKASRFTGLGSLLAGEITSQVPEDQDEPPAQPGEDQGTPIVIYEPSETQGLREVVFKGGPRASVVLDLESYTGYQTYLLESPARLVLDLYGVSGQPFPALEVDSPVLSAVRTSRFDEQTLRVVCDLKAPTGYQVPLPGGGLRSV